MFSTYIFLPGYILTYHITTKEKLIYETLHLYFGKYCIDIKIHSCDSLNINIYKNNEIYIVEYDSSIIRTIDPIKTINKIVSDYSKISSMYYAFHGGAIEYNNEAIILLAHTHMGKSTFVTFLTFNGFNYITDDCILINREDKRVMSYTTPIRLRKGGITVLQKETSEILKNVKLLSFTDRYIYAPKTEAQGTFKISKIIFLELSDENHKSFLDFEKTFSLLIASTCTSYSFSKQYIAFLSELSSEGAYYIKYNSLKDAYEMLTSILFKY